MNDELFVILKKFLKQEKYQINYEELELQLLSHPSFPSLHSVTGVLDHFDIENIALEVPTNMEILEQLPPTFISLIGKQKNYVVVHKKKDSVELTYGNNDKKSLSNAAFIEDWTGILVAVEKVSSETAGGKTNENKGMVALYALTALLTLGMFFFGTSGIFQIMHYFLSLIGLVISGFIIRHEMGYKSKIVDKLCTGKETANCESVLNSKGASLGKNLKLSDLGFVYFSMLSLTWLMSIFFVETPGIVVALTLLSLPITLYSLYYQWRIVKQWCPLCLGIVAVLWLQGASLFFYSDWSNIQFVASEALIFMISALLTISFWVFVKPLLEDKQEFKKNKIAHYKFIRNFELFYTLYNKGESKTPMSPGILGKEIVLGNKNAMVELTLVTNPSCFYCKEAHTDLEKVLHKDAKNVKLRIRFSVDIRNKENAAYKMASRLLEIYHTEPNEVCMTALSEAYAENMDKEKWLQKWKHTTSNIFDGVLEQQKEWCSQNALNFTPAVLINNKLYPKMYDRSEIPYFIEDLMEKIEADTEGVLEETY